VNALALGMVSTDMTENMNADFRDKILSQIPLARFANTEEVADIICFLLSDSAKYITGQVIQADGGLAM
jgi:3-oxoacyl-[acyl-carrier protein] reductase